LQAELHHPVDMAQAVAQREALKRDQHKAAEVLFKARMALVDLKRKNPSLGDKADDDLLVDKERPAKRPATSWVLSSFSEISWNLTFSQKTCHEDFIEVRTRNSGSCGQGFTTQRTSCADTIRVGKAWTKVQGTRLSLGRLCGCRFSDLLQLSHI
jgi:hypothetical protein